MADWNLLRSALGEVDESVRYTWDELDALVEGLPASATNHRAWWSGDRPHVNAWRLAGFTVANLVPGREVTFVRSRPRSRPVTDSATSVGAGAPQVGAGEAPTLLLVACVKEKLPVPAAARDLYLSPLFREERAYAERSGLPWFILSAEHGLVAPDEWLAPYERYLPDTPSSFRQAWGMWVAERLDLLAGPLRTQVIEIHAGSAYIDPLRGHLTTKGASLLEPLAGLAMGQRLAWYAQTSPGGKEGASATRSGISHGSTDEICEQLTDTDAALTPKEFLDRGAVGLNVPGLYSWWVDAAGAGDLTKGLGLPLNSGLIYAGTGGSDPLAKRPTLIQHPVVPHLWHAPRQPSRVLDLSTNARFNSGPRSRRTDDRRSRANGLDECPPQGRCCAIRRCRHPRPARGRCLAKARSTPQPQGQGRIVDPETPQGSAQAPLEPEAPHHLSKPRPLRLAAV